MDSNLRLIFLHLLNVMNLETSQEKIPYNVAWLSAVLQPALTHSWCTVSTAVNPFWVTSGLAFPTSACISSDMIHDVLDPVTLLAQWLRNSGNNLVCCIPWPRPWRKLYLDEALLTQTETSTAPSPFTGIQVQTVCELSFGQIFVIGLWPMA
jgi:hypothetical protein